MAEQLAPLAAKPESHAQMIYQALRDAIVSKPLPPVQCLASRSAGRVSGIQASTAASASSRVPPSRPPSSATWTVDGFRRYDERFRDVRAAESSRPCLGGGGRRQCRTCARSAAGVPCCADREACQTFGE